jgi:hypothetical protein
MSGEYSKKTKIIYAKISSLMYQVMALKPVRIGVSVAKVL